MRLGESKALGVVHEGLMGLEEGGLDDSLCAEKLMMNLNALILLFLLFLLPCTLFSLPYTPVPLAPPASTFLFFCFATTGLWGTVLHFFYLIVARNDQATPTKRRFGE